MQAIVSFCPEAQGIYLPRIFLELTLLSPSSQACTVVSLQLSYSSTFSLGGKYYQITILNINFCSIVFLLYNIKFNMSNFLQLHSTWIDFLCLFSLSVTFSYFIWFFLFFPVECLSPLCILDLGFWDHFSFILFFSWVLSVPISHPLGPFYSKLFIYFVVSSQRHLPNYFNSCWNAALQFSSGFFPHVFCSQVWLWIFWFWSFLAVSPLGRWFY